VINYDLHIAEATADSPELAPRYGSGVKLRSKKGGFEFTYTGVDERILTSLDVEAIERKNNFASTWSVGACVPEHDFGIISRSVVPSSGSSGRFDVTFIGECRHTGICLAPPEQWQRDTFAVDAIEAFRAREDHPLRDCEWLKSEVRARTHRHLRL
jgi:hypothetical protein